MYLCFAFHLNDGLAACRILGSNDFPSTFKIRNVPTVLFIVNGEVKDKSVGAVPKAKLTEKLDALL